jgi:addiction module RelE/StbE family toxin
MHMWTIYEKKSLLKTLRKTPIEVIKHYELWKRIVELEGIQGLKLIKGYRDEALKGEWASYRSSRLTNQWRVIYKVEKKLLEVYVVDVNPHDYRKR